MSRLSVALGVLSFAAMELRASRSCAQREVRVSGSMVTPLAAPQTLAFGPGAGASLVIASRVAPWTSLGGGLEGALLSLVPAQLPQGVRPPSGVGTWVAAHVVLRVQPTITLSRVRPFIDVSLAVGMTGSRVAPSLSTRAGVALRFGPISVAASVGYWRLFDLLPSVLHGDGQFLTAAVEVSHVWEAVAAPRPRAPRVASVVAVDAPVRRCPRVAASIGLEDPGCPDGDRDGDSLPDTVDRCPDVPEDRDGFEDSDGCPDPDNDHDQLDDTVDRCPLAAEVVNGVDDDDGCPDETMAHVAAGRVEYVDQLRFYFNSIRLQRESDAVLRDIARLLVAHPEFALVYVEGHADSIGDEHYNHRLSYLRARAVIDALARHGVARGRLVAAGYGARIPIAHGGAYWDRSLNRRVTFVLDGRRTPGRMFDARGYRVIDVGGSIP